MSEVKHYLFKNFCKNLATKFEIQRSKQKMTQMEKYFTENDIEYRRENKCCIVLNTSQEI